MLLNFGASSSVAAAAAMEVAVSVLIIGTCGPLFVILVWAVVDPHKIDAWAESNHLVAKLKAQTDMVKMHGKKISGVVQGGEMRGKRFWEKADAGPVEDPRPSKHGLQWVLKWVAEGLGASHSNRRDQRCTHFRTVSGGVVAVCLLVHSFVFRPSLLLLGHRTVH